jgi:beta-glucosidase
VGQEPLYYDALSTGRPADKVDLTHPPRNSEEKYHSRYIDEQNAPLYPFGYGLSYSNFEFSGPQLSATTASAAAINNKEQSIRVSATVKNNSNRAGDAVVQLYVRQRGTSVARPVRELKGFKKVALAAGESRTVEFTLGREELAFWNLDMQETVEPAQVTVWVAGDSASGTPSEFKITP